MTSLCGEIEPRHFVESLLVFPTTTVNFQLKTMFFSHKILKWARYESCYIFAFFLEFFLLSLPLISNYNDLIHDFCHTININ